MKNSGWENNLLTSLGVSNKERGNEYGYSPFKQGVTGESSGAG
ncbi:hypothetical protein [Paenibacillus sp.]|jgi:hypothetical protein|nr:hypothetical protein [Paenibacillus sp.]